MKALSLAIIGLVGATFVQSAGGQDRPSAQELATRTVGLLVRGEFQPVAESMHYPPSYTPAQRQKDVTTTAAGLDLTAREFGEISDPKLHAGSAEFYEVGGSGGSVAYLSSMKPYYSGQFLFDAKFSKLGDGYVRIAVIQLTADAGFEVLGVYFGLQATPHSKATLADITRRQLIHMNVPITPDLERQIDALKPIQYPS
jgi:hypothetical protein